MFPGYVVAVVVNCAVDICFWARLSCANYSIIDSSIMRLLWASAAFVVIGPLPTPLFRFVPPIL